MFVPDRSDLFFAVFISLCINSQAFGADVSFPKKLWKNGGDENSLLLVRKERAPTSRVADQEEIRLQ
jgi:hypothetical protein